MPTGRPKAVSRTMPHRGDAATGAPRLAAHHAASNIRSQWLSLFPARHEFARTRAEYRTPEFGESPDLHPRIRDNTPRRVSPPRHPSPPPADDGVAPSKSTAVHDFSAMNTHRPTTAPCRNNRRRTTTGFSTRRSPPGGITRSSRMHRDATPRSPSPDRQTRSLTQNAAPRLSTTATPPPGLLPTRIVLPNPSHANHRATIHTHPTPRREPYERPFAARLASERSKRSDEVASLDRSDARQRGPRTRGPGRQNSSPYEAVQYRKEQPHTVITRSGQRLGGVFRMRHQPDDAAVGRRDPRDPSL